jgi:HTH-type transcriptional regulator / antitoxin HigA
MTDQHTPFAPDWVSPPGDAIQDLAEERGWSQQELARRLGYTEKHVSQLVNGKVALTVDAAQRLERVLGSTLDFWLNLEANFRRHSARIAAQQQQATWVDWLDELPLKDIMACGALPKVRLNARSKPGLVDACLKLFGVASPQEWRAHYGAMQVDFRRSGADQADVGAIATWLRLGERQAEKLEGPPYDALRFKHALVALRALTTEPPEVFEPIMRQLLHDAGVAFVLVPAIPRARVSGVARWLAPHRPLIQLSLYGKTNDKFWFTFFHEAAHVLLHSGNKSSRSSIFLDDPNGTGGNDPMEREADAWARQWLIPEAHDEHLAKLRTKASVRAFADTLGIHPAIVVGRLQYERIIPPSWFNDLKVPLLFSTFGQTHA